MTHGPAGAGAGSLTPAEQRLAAVHLQVVEFTGARAARGDVAARGHFTGFTQGGHPYPPRPLVRSWLADCRIRVPVAG